MAPSARRRWPRRLLVALVSLVLVDQLVLYTLLADGELRGTPVAPFDKLLFSDHQRSNLTLLKELLAGEHAHVVEQSVFDADLGWCPPRGRRWARIEFDESGSRLGPEPLPRERDGGKRLIGLVGCSFTLGSEVEDSETFAYLLDERWPDTRVGNFAMGGYGPDQALLRYRRDVAPLEPDEVWFGLFPPATLRASSHFPPLYYRWRAQTIQFKPRFSVDDAGELTFQPSPAREAADVATLLDDRAAFLTAMAADPWVARAPAAYRAPGSHWTHYSAFTRLLLTLHERRGRDVRAALTDESSDLFRLNRALVLQLAREVEQAGGRFRLLLLPGRKEVDQLGGEGRGYWQPLLASLESEGLEALDLTPAFVEQRAGGDDTFWMPGGHYSPRGHQLVMDAIADVWGE